VQKNEKCSAKQKKKRRAEGEDSGRKSPSEVGKGGEEWQSPEEIAELKMDKPGHENAGGEGRQRGY
jgi:hypothetical protein